MKFFIVLLVSLFVIKVSSTEMGYGMNEDMEENQDNSYGNSGSSYQTQRATPSYNKPAAYSAPAPSYNKPAA